MKTKAEIERFVASTFRSVWDLELLLELRRTPGEARTKQDLVSALRASEEVVVRGIQVLLAGGVVSQESDGSVTYGPASSDIDEAVGGAADLYRSKPDAVRRLIIARAGSGIAAFSDAFRIKGD